MNFKSINFLSLRRIGQVTVASRNDIPENTGNNLVLDVDNTRFVDNYIIGGIKVVHLTRTEKIF